jgi:serine/threonine-protein phosphatase PGAM5
MHSLLTFTESSIVQEDEKRLLTPLGREQAALTGKRLGQLIRGVNEEFGPCKVKVVRVSDLARAKETADIIYDNMELEKFDGEAVKKAEPDPLLNEGRPCHHIPGGKVRQSVIEKTDDHHPRIEQAFNKYFHRAPMPELPSAADRKEKTILATTSYNQSNENEKEKRLVADPKHEFEIIVCHANVIRYFFCRALQLPPEAWLRLCTFNCSLTYFTIRPTGTVSCRMLGDIGHLPHHMCTFSMHTGFNW